MLLKHQPLTNNLLKHEEPKKVPLDGAFFLFYLSTIMFSFFRKKDSGVKRTDLVWISEEQKLRALASAMQHQPTIRVVCWFPETLEKITAFLEANGQPSENILLADRLRKHEAEGFPLLFAEHYPLYEKEAALYERLQLKEAIVHTSLDEPFMKKFGGEKMIALMKKLGAKEDEAIQHTTVSSAIKNAQQKLKEKLVAEHSATSQADWMKRNSTD